MHKLIARTREEGGFVMIIALIVVVIVVLLATAIVSSGVTTSNNASKEYGRSAAVAAADAGLYAAIHRLSSQPEETKLQQEECFTTKFVAAASGVCEGYEESVGNGATYKYYVYPVMTENTCTGLWIEGGAGSGKTVSQRCITSIGKAANGVTARVQQRVADIKGGIFPVNGIFSYSSLIFINKLTYSKGELGARGLLQLNNTFTHSEPTNLKYGELKLHETCKECTETKLTPTQLAESPYALPEQSVMPYKEAEKTNNNKNLVFTPLAEGSVNASRELIAKEPTIVMPSGTYSFCYMEIKNKATIEYTPPVSIYIDAAYRAGSTCPNNSKTGTTEFVNTVNWVDKAATPKASDLKIFAWGKPPEANKNAPPLKFTNTVTGPLYAEIYAPYSNIHFVNTLKMNGAIVAGFVEFTNTVEFGGELSTPELQQKGTSFYGAAYHVCPPSYKESSPGSGCY